MMLRMCSWTTRFSYTTFCDLTDGSAESVSVCLPVNSANADLVARLSLSSKNLNRRAICGSFGAFAFAALGNCSYCPTQGELARHNDFEFA